jgi:hypothetical protein
MAGLNRLGKLRRRTQPTLSLKQVARFYRDGVTTQRISQVETSGIISPSVERDYKAALLAAIAARREAMEALEGLVALRGPTASSSAV